MEMINLLASCGKVDIPDEIVGLVQTIVFIIQVVVPILLIIWGMLDFAKSVIGGDEDKIKAGQKLFIKRVIAAIIVFLVITITQLVITTVGNIGGNDASDAWKCARTLLGK